MHPRCQLGVVVAEYDDGNKIQSVGSHGEVIQVAMIAGDEDRSGLPIPRIEQARDDAVKPFLRERNMALQMPCRMEQPSETA